MGKWMISVIILFSFSYNIYGQKELLKKEINLPNDLSNKTQKDFLNYLSNELNVVFSYNANLLTDDKIINIPENKRQLRDILYAIFSDHKLLILTLPPNKFILQSKGDLRKQILFSLSGTVRDKLSGELVNGAIITENHSNTSVITNEHGYFIFKTPQGMTALEVRYLGYKTQSISMDISTSKYIDIYMENDNELPMIIIDGKSRHNLNTGGELMDLFGTKDFVSIIGEKDIINNARIIPGIQSGGEGQSGLYVRGGSPDQNLILLEGIALYETSHTAGVSSIFIEESIKEASLHRNGFPARYGGRLSSVLDINLKDGDKSKNNTLISVGVPGAKVHLNGPIKNSKTTYNLSARTSWLNFYVNNILRKYTKYDNINIGYSDVLGKITHTLSPSSSISLMVYTGFDNLQLTKDETIRGADYSLNIFDRNGLNWGNKMASLKWNALLNDKFAIKMQAGALNYNNGSRSSYKFTSTSTQPDTVRTNELDVISKSNIIDYNVRADLEYYLNDKHVLRAGSNVLIHKFNPTIKQSTFILEGDAESIIDKDSLISSSEYNFYVEDNFKINTDLFLYGGLHMSVFNVNNTTYQSFQPRLKIIATPHERHMISVAYSKMTQFVHLLSNSGLGLPSDLWVTSTENVAPENAHQFSMNYTYNINEQFYVSVGGYLKTFENSLEYTSPTELFYFLINNDNIVPVFNTSKDWERNLVVGESNSRGLELLIHKKDGKLKGWISTSFTKTERQFPTLNQGLPFPATYDRPLNMNTGLSYQLSDAFSFGLNFVYATGNTFSLATEEYEGILGTTLLKSNGRNNYRLPAFHHLSLNANYTVKGKHFDTLFEFNVYNVYNRLNAYFIYIYRNPEPPNDATARKVSILPITPSVNVSIKF
ncbi:MAG TPA: carboxypeptidase-like regulatory domain-containing protein [Saprospiraceae bacterium]|nr:carboxypeptidase-like regulatory domain-containing protein [Saprospiraceae bacterium]